MNVTFLTKHFVITAFFCCLWISSSFAQQWAGSSGLNGNLYRNGRVGIGTNNPLYELHVRDGGDANTAASLFIQPREWNSVGDFGEVRIGDPFHYIRGEFKNGMTLYDFDQIRFRVGGNNAPVRMFIANNGFVGIGTEAPSHPLTIESNTLTGLQFNGQGDSTFAGAFMNGGRPFYGYKREGSSVARHYVHDADTSWRLRVGGADDKLFISPTGNVGINTTEIIGSSNFVVKSNREVGYGGMYMQMDGPGADKRPFYGYAVDGNFMAWHYFANRDSTLRMYNGEDRLTIERTGNVGIGTNTPQARLEVRGDILANRRNLRLSLNNTADDDGMGMRYVDGGTMALYSDVRINFQEADEDSTVFSFNLNSGRMGIGTDAPNANLEVIGNIVAMESSVALSTRNNSLGDGMGMRYVTGGTMALYSDGLIDFQESDTDDTRIRFDMNAGRVGIGTTNLTARLNVNGRIRAEEIEVISNVPSSDFVFEEDYDLRPLEEVEAFVKENKHLPEIPSAEEFKENGYKLGDMDDLLLRKVEELTLYMIDLKKENEILKEKIKALEENK